MSRFMIERGGLIAVAVLVAYVVLAPEYVVDGDNAEFSSLGTVGGVAHPSGYPLYLIYLRAMSWIPGNSPAHTAAIATALLAAMQALTLHVACRAWGARPLAATAAVAIFAAGPIALRVQTEAEVFAMNGLVVAAILWLSAAKGPFRGMRRAFALGLVAGLGCSAHMTCTLLAPVGLLGVMRGMREAQERARVAALAVAGFVLGLAPYLYLMVTRDTLLSWTSIDDLPTLARHMLRYDYGGPGHFSPRAGIVDPLRNEWALLLSLMRSWAWIPFALGIAGLVHACARAREGTESRAAWMCFAVSFALAGPLLVMRFNLYPVGLNVPICERFHLLPAMLLTIPVAYGLDGLASRLPTSRPSLRSPVIGATICVATFVALTAGALPHVSAAHSPALEQAASNMLRSVPRNSVIIVSSDDAHFGTGYLQSTFGLRPDVVVITWPRVPSKTYRARIAERTGVSIDEIHTDGPLSVAVAARILEQGRPLFVDSYGANIVKNFPTYPYGVLFRVLPRGTTSPTVAEMFEINKRVFEEYRFGYEFPKADPEIYPAYIHSEYARVWAIIADATGRAGLEEQQKYAIDMARALGPQAN